MKKIMSYVLTGIMLLSLFAPISVEAVEKMTEEYRIEVKGGDPFRPIGSGQDEFRSIEKAKPGETVFLFVNDEKTPGGKEFANWIVDSKNVSELLKSERGIYYFVMPAEEVKIHAEYKNKPKEYKIETTENVEILVQDVNTGNYKEKKTAKAGETVYISADKQKTKDGYRMTDVKDAKGNISDLRFTRDTKDAPSKARFTMPSDDVSLKITYENNKVYNLLGDKTEYLAYVEDDGYYQISEEKPGSTVHLGTHELSEEEVFVKWKDVKGNVILSDPNKYNASFEMPKADVHIDPVTIPGHPVAVEDGYVTRNIQNGEYYEWEATGAAPGEDAWLYLWGDWKIPEGQEFSRWIVESGNVELDDPTDPEGCHFVMPDEPVEISVEYVESGESYELITNDKAYYWDGDYLIDNAKVGEKVKLDIDYDNLKENEVFTGWKVLEGDVSIEINNPSIEFIMPAEGVHIEPTFKTGNTIKIEDGYGVRTVNGTENYEWYVGAALPGDVVFIYLEEDANNRQPLKWEVRKGNIELNDPEDFSGCSFVMPDEPVEIDVIYDETEKPDKTEGKWDSDSKGKWYTKPDGTYAVGWEFIDGEWYYFNRDGYMHTGWKQIAGIWYVLDSDGKMLHDTWYQGIYYLDSNGAMMTNTVTPDGYYVNASGEYVPNKWHSDSIGYWYVKNGKYVTGWEKISGEWYYFNRDGYMVTGWKKISDKWYYFAGDGHMVTGWKKISGEWYYFQNDGYMVTGWQYIGGLWYVFTGSGEMLHDTWYQNTYYLGSDGAMLTNTVTPDGWIVDENGVCVRKA